MPRCTLSARTRAAGSGRHAARRSDPNAGTTRRSAMTLSSARLVVLPADRDFLSYLSLTV